MSFVSQPGKVTQDITIFLYEKTRQDSDYSIRLCTNISREALHVDELKKLDFTEMKRSEISKLTGTDYQVPIFTAPKAEKPILIKLAAIPAFEGDKSKEIPRVGILGEGHLHETANREYISDDPKDDLLVKGHHIDRYFVNLDPEGPKPRWVKKKDFLKEKPQARNVIEKERLIWKRSVNRSQLYRLQFVYLDEPLIMTNTVCYLIDPDKNLDLYYLLGLLNSHLLTWRFKLTSMNNDIREYQIEALPIVRAAREIQESIARNVKELLKLKLAKYEIRKIWEEWSSKLKNHELSLRELLNIDAGHLSKGENGLIWTRKALFYPADQHSFTTELKQFVEGLDEYIIRPSPQRLTITIEGQSRENGTVRHSYKADSKADYYKALSALKSFDSFVVVANPEDAILKIFGKCREEEEKLCQEIQFRDPDLLEHVYFCLAKTLDSKLKILTLDDLFAKTTVPIIQTDKIPNTKNLIAKVRKDFSAWGADRGFTDLPQGFVEVEKKLLELDSQIEADILNLYRLSRSEAKTVLTALDVPAFFRDSIISHLS